MVPKGTFINYVDNQGWEGVTVCVKLVSEMVFLSLQEGGGGRESNFGQNGVTVPKLKSRNKPVSATICGEQLYRLK